MKPALAAVAAALAVAIFATVLVRRETREREVLERRIAALESDLSAARERQAAPPTATAGDRPAPADSASPPPPTETKAATEKRLKKMEAEIDRLEDKVRDLSRASHGSISEEVAGLPGEKLWDKAQMALHDKLTERADALLREFLQRFPNDPHVAEALLALGNSELRVEDWPEASEFYNKIVTEHPDSPQAPFAEFYLGMSLIATGNLAGGREHYERSIEKFAGNPYWQAAALVNLGTAYIDKGQPEAGKEYLRRVSTQFAGDEQVEPLVKQANELLKGLERR